MAACDCLQEVRRDGQHVEEVGKVRRQFGNHRSGTNFGTVGRETENGHASASYATAVCISLFVAAYTAMTTMRRVTQSTE